MHFPEPFNSRNSLNNLSISSLLTHKMLFWKIAFYVVGLIPWGFIVALYAFYFRAWDILGKAPRYNQPDPKELEIYSYYAPYINGLAEIWSWSTLGWIGMIMIYLVMFFVLKWKKFSWGPIAFGVVSHICAILLLFTDVFVWYMD